MANLRVIEQGWNSYRKHVVPADAPEVQVNECRNSYYAGALILFESIFMIMDDDREPTAQDLQRMSDIQAELQEFGAELDKKAHGGMTQ